MAVSVTLEGGAVLFVGVGITRALIFCIWCLHWGPGFLETSM